MERSSIIKDGAKRQDDHERFLPGNNEAGNLGKVAQKSRLCERLQGRLRSSFPQETFRSYAFTLPKCRCVVPI